MIVTNAIELAWAAGFFEGEGCVHIRKAGRRFPRLQLHIAQCDSSETLERFARAVNFNGSILGPYMLQGKPRVYQLVINGKSAHTAMEMIFPYLSEDSPKVERYNQALAAGCIPEKRTRWGTLSDRN